MKNYKDNREFLSKYFEIVELKSGSQSLIATPDLQGRIMCSTSDGEMSEGYGWINYDLIASGEILKHSNNWGGEDRFWLGPEGGQFSLFFAEGSNPSFDFEDWQTPAVIDTERWEIASKSESSVKFTKDNIFTNRHGSKFDCRLNREVKMLSRDEIESVVGESIAEEMSVVGFSSDNTITNIGQEAWNEDCGALSIWILGQFNPSGDNDVILPVSGGASATIKGDYFGEIPADRLRREADQYLFKADGKMRGKVGVPPASTRPIAMALDREREILTIVTFSFDKSNSQYVNSAWEMQQEPLRGDVINAYNDGPLEDGTIMGGFYEIESSSPALLLSPSQSHTHTHTTIHIKGDLAKLQQMVERL